MTRANSLYARNQEHIITIFDVSDAKTAERLGKEIVTRRGCAHLHALGPETYALVVRSDGSSVCGTSTTRKSGGNVATD